MNKEKLKAFFWLLLVGVAGVGLYIVVRYEPGLGKYILKRTERAIQILGW